jgi:hypothetical protein
MSPSYKLLHKACIVFSINDDLCYYTASLIGRGQKEKEEEKEEEK